MKNNKNKHIVVIVLTGLAILLGYQNCSKSEFVSKSSTVEEGLLANQQPFVKEPEVIDKVDPNKLINGSINDLLDSTQVSIPYKDQVDHLVKRCTPDVYEKEKLAVIEKAKNNNHLIPVSFALSTGDKFDGSLIWHIINQFCAKMILVLPM